MKTLSVKTGFGYFTEIATGNIISRAELPPGEHPLKDDYNYTEVETRAELDAVRIYEDPAAIDNRENEKKIAGKIRTDAIAALVATGDLPGDYK